MTGHNKPPQHGFTLLELMITISVLGVLTVIAIPMLGQFITANRISSATNELNASLRNARDYAMRMQKNVYLCPSNDGINCISSNNWNKGWITFVDLNGDGKLDPAHAVPFADTYPADTTDLLLSGSQNVRTKLNITMSGLAGASLVRFFPNGEGHSYAGSDSYYSAGDGMLAFRTDTVQFTVCDAGGDQYAARKLEISAIGKPQSGPLPQGESCP